MKNHVISSFFLAAVLIVACSPIKKSAVNQPEKPVFEIAVRQVKADMASEFEAARAAFIEELTRQDGVSNDREFASFYALPQPDERQVYIGMTEYATPRTPGKVQGKMSVVSKFLKFKKTMDLKAYVFVQPTEGPAFNLAELARAEGKVLELAVRRVNEGQEAAFQSSRAAFVSWLNKQPGVEGSWEFAVVGGSDTERLTVGMSVYNSQEAFQAIAGQVSTLPEAGAYFGTFEPVALQYAASVK